MTQTGHSLWIRLRGYVHRPWYAILVAILAGLDLFIMVIPTDGMLITSVLIRPKSWMKWFIAVSLGSALGALALAALIHIDPEWIKDSVLYGAFHSGTWYETESFIHKHGGWALMLIAASIFPQQPAVVIAALGGMGLLEIFLSVLLGRVLKYSVLSYVAAKSPGYIKRLWFVRKEVERFER